MDHVDDLRRIEDLWFDDGDLVLQAGNAQYRVYRVVLGMHSLVFRDMLAFPQPAASDSERVEGQPLVHLPDLEREVTPFLKALFDPEYFRAFPAASEFSKIYASVHMGNKYGVDFLCHRGLVHLSSRFRTTLSQWDSEVECDDKEGILQDLLPSEIISWPAPVDKLYLIASIQLAREVDALWILPAAFYHLACNYDNLRSSIFHDGVFNEIPVSLSAADQWQWCAGLEEQISATTLVLRFLGYPLAIQGCSSPDACLLERFKVVDYGINVLNEHSRGPLTAWDADDWKHLNRLCPTCLSALTTSHQAARQKFWNELPGIYGLPPWPELNRMKTAAIGAVLV
ncbi:hypothetical protein C8F01DRAFT_1369043 [Mycena amicta]|nr:hypothetical protein C8F01DRAFT_1369043 [Mycena amicta]